MSSQIVWIWRCRASDNISRAYLAGSWCRSVGGGRSSLSPRTNPPINYQTMLKLLRTVDQLPQAGPIIFLLNLWPRCQHLDSICIFNTQSVRPPMTEGPLKRILVTVSLKHFIGMLSVYKMQIHNTQHWLHWLSRVPKVHLLDFLNI